MTTAKVIALILMWTMVAVSAVSLARSTTIAGWVAITPVGLAVIGTWFDSMLVALGWVAYPSGQWHALLAPYWIISMWMLFATTLNLSLKWLRGRPWLAAAVGAVAGPLTYLAGTRLGAIEFVNQDAALAALGVGWAVMLPILVTLGTRFDGFAKRPVEVLLR